MQLFITDLIVNDNNTITIENKEILDQIRKVLRGKVGDIYFFQNLEGLRWKAQVYSRDKKTFQAKIINQVIQEYDKKIFTQIIVAYPNKWSKAELIVQKLTEIGIDKIVFWPAERSIIRKKNENKEKRILSIVKESAEQSWRRSLPEIEFAEDDHQLFDSAGDKMLLIFDVPKLDKKTISIDSLGYSNEKIICGAIGPEGGLTQKDYAHFGSFDAVVNLSNTILRMETAAILAAREIFKIGNSKQ